MLTVSGLYIYPIKSLGGIYVDNAFIKERGFEHDRRWMLIDKDNRFLSQREYPAMALLDVKIETNGLLITHKTKSAGNKLTIGFNEHANEKITVTIWDDVCLSYAVGKEKDEWFSDMLETECRLVYMPEESLRYVDERYAQNKEITSFSDGYPLLLIGQASLDDLNDRLAEPVPMNRFRPNIVFTGGYPYQEDDMKQFKINDISFSGVKLCARCVMTTIEQSTGVKNKEPLATLASYRRDGNKIYFGQNVLFNGYGKVSVGDVIHV